MGWCVGRQGCRLHQFSTRSMLYAAARVTERKNARAEKKSARQEVEGRVRVCGGLSLMCVFLFLPPLSLLLCMSGGGLWL